MDENNHYEEIDENSDFQRIDENSNDEKMNVEEISAEDKTLKNDGNTDKNDSVPAKRKKLRIKKPKKGILQLVLVAVLSSMLGGGTVFAAMLGTSAGSSAVNSASSGLTYKNVAITESSSPVEAIAEKVSPSVVGIKVTVAQQQSGFFFNSGDATSEGSGIIISDDGYILTNNHVVEGALTSGTNNLSNSSKIEVVLPDQTDKTYTAALVGRDSESDLAVLKIDATGLPEAELGDSSQLKVGELAVAIGNPGGLDYMGSVTTGIISGLNRTLTTSEGKELKLIQTDAAINPGNSGGPLVNSAGQIIGINTVKISATGYEGLGFAIPINDAKQIAQDLIDYTYVKGRPLIGLSIDQRYTEEFADSKNMPAGLLVSDVTQSGPAETAGIKIGDIIAKFDGKAVKTFAELNTLKDAHKPGEKVAVEIYRDGQTKTLTITLGEEKV